MFVLMRRYFKKSITAFAGASEPIVCSGCGLGETKNPGSTGIFEFGLVTPQGFEPRTFASVVRCSIQLSYGAIPWKRTAKVVLF